MRAAAQVTVHQSQFPEAVRRDLIHSLRSRKINHKFHYDSIKQTQKWLALHQAWSPSRNDENVRLIYEQAFRIAAAKTKSKRIHVIGLGCGGGQKDTRLLRLLTANGKKVFYTPCDVSTAMVLVARKAALAVLPEQNCFPFVCDLVQTDNLRKFLVPRHTSLVTFFGMIPNFEPQVIMPKLSSLLGPKDLLLFSANLAPGTDYAAGMRKILPQYDNSATRDWLMTFLRDLGIGERNGQLRIRIEDDNSGAKRIVAHFHFLRPIKIEIEDHLFQFKAGETIRLFFSCRYAPEMLGKRLKQNGLHIMQQWVSDSEEEGVFLCRKQ